MDVSRMEEGFETPDITKEDMVGGAGGLGIFMLAMESENQWIQVAALAAVTIISVAITVCGTIRRGSRAKHLGDRVHYLDTPSTEAREESDL